MRRLQAIVPGPAGAVLTDAVDRRTGRSSGHWFALAFGTVGALITGTTLMGQIERALNRLYGVEQDRPTFAEVRPRVRARPDGRDPRRARVRRPRAGQRDRRVDRGKHGSHDLERGPLAARLALLVAAIALLFRWAPRRRQPAWSWLAFGARGRRTARVVTVGLGFFFRFSTSFGSTYGRSPASSRSCSGRFFSAIAVLIGAAVAAQLEAVRAGAATPDSTRKVAESEPDPTVPTATVPCRDG